MGTGATPAEEAGVDLLKLGERRDRCVAGWPQPGKHRGHDPLDSASRLTGEFLIPQHYPMGDLRLQPAQNIPSPLAGSALLRSEEHTSELQSPCNLVCRFLLR